MENVSHKKRTASSVSHGCAIRSKFRSLFRAHRWKSHHFLSPSVEPFHIHKRTHRFFLYHFGCISYSFALAQPYFVLEIGKMGFICSWHKQPFPRHIFNQLHISPKMNCANFLKNEDRERERERALNAFGILFQFTWSLVFVALWTAFDGKVWHR